MNSLLRLAVARFVVAVIAVVLCVGCGSVPTDVGEVRCGSLEVQVQMGTSLYKTTKTQETQFDSVVVEISGGGMDTFRIAKPIDFNRRFFLDTINGIPAGSKRFVKVTTVNKNSDVIHVDSAGVRTIEIDPNAVPVLPVVLVPTKGSIYLQITDIPTSVDSIKAAFVAVDGTHFTVESVRKTKVYLSIDNIKHNTSGVLVVAGLSPVGDTLYCAQKEVTVSAYTTTSVDLVFKRTPGGLALSLKIVLPGVTITSGTMDGDLAAISESGGLLITEIMYAANDSEYIELFNPGESEQVFDTLILDIDGKERIFKEIVITARSYYVLGRTLSPWIDKSHEVKSALDLSSTGNWITVKKSDGEVLDRVVFAGGTNTLGWPRVVEKTSVVLNANAYFADDNNYGRSWTASTLLIDSTTAQKGTPGEL